MSPPSRAIVRWGHRLLTGSILFLIAWFYVWTVGQGHLVHFGKTRTDPFYNGLTDAFLAGHLSLPTEPHPQLKALRDPYDPRQSEPFRLHDASYYNGKYYLYFGVTPVVLLFLPFRAFGMGDMPQYTAVAVFMFAGVVFWFLTLSLVRRRCLPDRGAGVLYATLVTLGFGGAIPFLLRRPSFYEVAIGCGFFCLAATVYFLVSVAFDERTSHWKAGLGSLFLGLAVGARPNLLLAAPFLGLVWMWKREQGYQQLRRLAIALVVPLFAVLFLLAAYNFARFGSPTEFGTSYQLAGLDVRLLHAEPKRIPFLAYFYLWHPAELNWVFPYVHASIAWVMRMPGFTLMEPVAGVFFTTPFLSVLALLPLVRGSTAPGSAPDRTSEHIRALGRVAWSLVAFAAVQIAFLSTRSGATMRYIPDFSGVLVTAAGLVVFALELRWRRVAWAGRLIPGVLVPLVVLSVFFNVGLGLTGYYDELKFNNPAAYESIRSAIDPIAKALASLVR
jgi:hypothetical protein